MAHIVIGLPKEKLLGNEAGSVPIIPKKSTTLRLELYVSTATSQAEAFEYSHR